jgi:hypothetical protein
MYQEDLKPNYERSVITIYAFIGDLHLCAGKLPRMDYVKSLNKFLGIIKEHKEQCHAIFVIGDLFDHKLSVEELEFASAFLVNLVCNDCGRDARRHVPVYFIHGTYTHDYEQYEIFLPMLEKIENVEVHYTNKATYCTLRNGVSVLCLPQEYGDVDYTELFSRQYDIIIGHGPLSSMVSSPCKCTKYEIMQSAEQLGSISKICVFGHFHGYTDFGNNVFYSGPWLRWKYGEDIDRVFFICNDEFKVETFPNEFALKYETFEVYSPDELRSMVSMDIKNPHRFIIHCKSEELPDYHAIMNAYKKNQYLKYQIISEDDDVEDMSLPEEHAAKPMVEPIPALIEYVKDKYNVDVTDEVKDYEGKINKEKTD